MNLIRKKKSKQFMPTLMSAMIILDYSGSMDQMIEKKTKGSVLKDSISEYLSVQSQNEKIDFIFFGSQPVNKCDDLQHKTMNPSAAQKLVNQLKPGFNGRTPLAASIRKTSALFQKKSSSVQSTEQIVIVTDGSDTCQQNPCEEVIKFDRLLTTKKTNIILDIIGFDIKNDTGLECFKNLQEQLKYIKLNLNYADSSKGLLKTLSNIGSAKTAKNKEGVLMISGSPPEEKFTAKITTASDRKIKTTYNWISEFRIYLPVGKYTISSQSGDQTVPVQIYEKKDLVILYSRFFKNRSSLINFDLSGLEVTAKPTIELIRAHGDTAEIRFDNQPHDLKFGPWNFVVNSPYWIKDQVKVFITIPNGQKFNLEAKTVFENELVWEPVNLTQSSGVIKSGKYKILVFPEQKQLPLNKNLENKWLVK